MVFSPEGCASILWRDGAQAATAAQALRLTARDLESLGVIDAIIPEPVGGAHRFPEPAIDAVGDGIDAALSELTPLDGAALKQQRRDKFLSIGPR